LLNNQKAVLRVGIWLNESPNYSFAMKTNNISIIDGFITDGLENVVSRVEPGKSVFWEKLKNTGTELWLDTGDIEGASRLWTREMAALTTNNTLLNNEIQKGIYDEFILEANQILDDLDLEERIIEIAFILNARHGLRLVNTFGAKVSVELHTDLAHDVDKSIFYAKRYHAINPDRFIIKVPLTPSGYITTRRIREMGIPVNFTLNFSARQNLIATIFSKPSYVNVFLGRLNAYVIDNQLGDGNMVGEKTTLASQQVVSEHSKNNAEATRQIAASMRDATQVVSLAGVDVFTMPLKVAKEALEKLDGSFSSRRGENYAVQLNNDVEPGSVNIENLWECSGKELDFALGLDKNPPATAEEFSGRAHEYGLQDLFPDMSREDLEQIRKDGKIPDHKKWEGRITSGTASIDALLNLAGLASFTSDQRALDDKIRKLIA
jgi:transaldolase